jgi:hypothetical protein
MDLFLYDLDFFFPLSPARLVPDLRYPSGEPGFTPVSGGFRVAHLKNVLPPLQGQISE